MRKSYFACHGGYPLKLFDSSGGPSPFGFIGLVAGNGGVYGGKRHTSTKFAGSISLYRSPFEFV